MTTNLGEGSTIPEFITGFDETDFVEIEEGGGLFVVAEDTNILLFPDSNDVGTGGDGTDILQGNGGDDNLQGAAGDDFVFGNDGDDIVRGGAGDDVLVGGRGQDIAISGSGSDIFEFFADQFAEGETDIIRDFELGVDSIVVVGSTDVSYNAETGLVSVDGLESISLGTAGVGLDLVVITREDSSIII